MAEIKEGTPEYEDCLKFKPIVEDYFKKCQIEIDTYKPMSVSGEEPRITYVVEVGGPKKIIATLSIGPKREGCDNPCMCIGERSVRSIGF